MSKITITEERLNSLIQECVEEVMLEEDFRGTMQNAWNGAKNFAGNVGQGAKVVAGAAGRGVKAAGRGIKNAASKVGQGVKNSGGIIPYAANLRGYAERRAEQFKNKVAQARRAGRAAADAKALQGPHPANYWKEKYGDNFVTLMGQILGGSYPKDRLVQALNTYHVSPEDQAEILKSKGYGATNVADQNAPMAEPSLNPTNQQNQNGIYSGNLGGNAGMDSAIEEAVARTINEFINEVGNKKSGQKKLAKLAKRRIEQAWKYDDLGDEEKAKEYGDRYKAASSKAREERDKVESPKKRKAMRNAYHKALNKKSKLSESIGGGYSYEILYNFNDATKFYDLTCPGAWCITYSKRFFAEYMKHFKAHYVVFMKDGYENVRREVGDGYTKEKPHDEYGNSLILMIQSNNDGSPLFITSRWNHGHNSDGTEMTEADHAYTPEEFYQITGIGPAEVQRIFDEWKQASAGKINEQGDTYKGQYKLGRLSGKRDAQASKISKQISKSTDSKEIEDLEKKRSDFINRSTAAYVKARDERDAKGNSWEPHQMQMMSAFNDGQKKERKKQMRKK